MSCNVTMQCDSQKVSTSHIKNRKRQSRNKTRLLTKLGLLLIFTTVSVTTLKFFLFIFYFFTVSCHFVFTAAWTPAWQTPPVRACSVVLQTAEGAVVL